MGGLPIGLAFLHATGDPAVTPSTAARAVRRHQLLDRDRAVPFDGKQDGQVVGAAVRARSADADWGLVPANSDDWPLLGGWP